MAGNELERGLSKSERLRNLEILKYGSTVRINYQDDIYVTAGAGPPRAADDALLTALCQLAAVRLDCANAFFCLSDSQKQHIVAEATRTVSPYDASIHAPGDGLLFGVTTFDADFGITQVTMDAYTRGSQHFVENQVTSINDHRSIFLDLHNEPLLRGVPFLQHDAPHRFYAEVAVKNAAGIVIGILAVLDDKPRPSFSEFNVTPLLDIARLIVEHLELVRLKDINAHAERLLQGLAHFNAGHSSIGNWARAHPGQVENLDYFGTDHKGNTHSATPAAVERARSSDESMLPSVTPTMDQPEYGRAADAATTAVASVTMLQSDKNAEVQALSDASEGAFAHRDALFVGANSSDATIASTPTGPDPAKQVALQLQHLFPRAANLIREAMNLNSTCFVEIPSDSQFSLDGRDSGRNRAQQSLDPLPGGAAADHGESSVTSNSDLEIRRNSSDGQLISSGEGKSDSTGCKYTAFSTTGTSGLTLGETEKVQARIPARALGNLVSAYPTGHIFHFDAHGPISSGDDQFSEQERNGYRSRRRDAVKMLSQIFPTARSLLFLPFYDGERQKMYSAFFGWVEDNSRVLVDNELVYVTGFAHSVMCEVLRLETLLVDRAKSVFMSSISHELRSPLHGILAATELLRETKLNGEQNELALMTESCGRTLLDIMNNLLEHAKINNTVDHSDKRKRQKWRRRKVGAQSGSRTAPAPASALETRMTVASLVEIVEETMASVVMGHAVKTQRAEQTPSGRPTLAATASDVGNVNAREPGRLTVILNIRQTDHWFFHIDPGAWRRIVMNLIGNALKYTSRGHVVAGLQVIDSRSRSSWSPCRVVFTMTDSGQGMSESYLKRSLFVPFTQEDQLSVGTGLGLSIVHRLVTELGGEVKVDSERGVGTNVRVIVPVPSPSRPKDVPADLASHQIAEARNILTSSDRVCFHGFTSPAASDSTPIGTMDTLDPGLMRLQDSLATMSTEWFGLQSTPDMDAATICFVEASYARVLLEQGPPSNIIFSKRYVVVTPYDEAKMTEVPWPGNHHVSTTPVGPLKLARALIALAQQSDGLDGETAARRQHPSVRVPVPPNECLSATSESLPPLVAPTASPLATQSGQPASRILLVDDNDINTRILAGLVRKLGNPFATARNGQEALDRFIAAYEEAEPFQFVFMDISMPVMNGLDSTRRIRAYENEKRKYSPAQIFALTGLGNTETQDEATASGVDQYFRKPVRMDTLRRSITSPELSAKKSSSSLSSL